VTTAGDVAYVTAVLMSYADLPETPPRPNPADRSVARNLYKEAVPLQLVESALLLGTLRRFARPAHLPPLPGIRSLAYFLPVIAELQQKPLPVGYPDYLRLKLRRLAQSPAPCSEKDVS
jgi:hypothetical protein